MPMKFLLRIGVQTMTNSKDIRRITPEEIENYAFCPADQVILHKLRREGKG